MSSLHNSQIRTQLSEREKDHRHEAEGCTWHPEYGAWMVESTPSRPYTGYAADLLRIERNMVIRRRRLLSALRDNEIAPTVSEKLRLNAPSFLVISLHKYSGNMLSAHGSWGFYR